MFKIILFFLYNTLIRYQRFFNLKITDEKNTSLQPVKGNGKRDHNGKIKCWYEPDKETYFAEY